MSVSESFYLSYNTINTLLFDFVFIGGRCLDANPLCMNELDTIISLLHHKKHVRTGEVRISDSLLLSLHSERTQLRVSAVDPK